MLALHLLQTLTVKRRTGKHKLIAAEGKYKLKTKSLKTFGLVLNILFLWVHANFSYRQKRYNKMNVSMKFVIAKKYDKYQYINIYTTRSLRELIGQKRSRGF